MSDSSQYDRFPQIPSGSREECLEGWPAITREIRARAANRSAIVIECYPGVFLDELAQALASAFPNVEILRTPDLFRPPAEIDPMLQPWLTDDPVFGIMNSIEIEDFFDPARLAEARARCTNTRQQPLIILGPGASLVCPQSGLLVYADLARWEIQGRQRRNQIPNLGADNFQQRPSLKYKRAFFVDWRAADRLKRRLLPNIDLLLDTNLPNQPKAIDGDTYRRALAAIVHRPFRVVPFFDPGPWGGHWMERVCGV
ncbi:MAG: mannose-6-phosphate isomerase, partial [Acidobacteriaceae bacterium]